MNIEEFRLHCISKKGVTEGFPFDNKTLVFKVMGKMFALVDVDEFESFNVKCDPEVAIDLRERYEAVNPGYHMNKQHWNTITNNLDMLDDEMKRWIDHSYDLIASSLSKKLKEELDSL